MNIYIACVVQLCRQDWSHLSCVFSVAGLKQALIVGIYLLSLVSVPCTISAPVMSDDRYKTAPKWINPAGITEDSSLSDYSMTTIPRDTLLKPTLSQARKALSEAEQLRELIVSTIVNSSPSKS